MPLLSDVPARRYQQSQPRYITCQHVCVQESRAIKRVISQLEVNNWRFVAMLSLHDKNQQ